jgi:hypothetical protein
VRSSEQNVALKERAMDCVRHVAALAVGALAFCPFVTDSRRTT